MELLDQKTVLATTKQVLETTYKALLNVKTTYEELLAEISSPSFSHPAPTPRSANSCANSLRRSTGSSSRTGSKRKGLPSRSPRRTPP